MNDTSMAECTKASFDVIAACGALETLPSVNSTYTPALAKVVEEVCLACKKECDKFPQYSECVDMGASCKACAEEVYEDRGLTKSRLGYGVSERGRLMAEAALH